MKLTLILALALAATGVTLVAAADEAAACIPPNCPGFGRCYVEEDHVAVLQEPVTGASYDVYTYHVECYY